MIFEELEWWEDEIRRGGIENMAIDRELLLSAERPLLRTYEWKDGWGSFGYFQKFREACEAVPEIKRWVRRETGGGVVNHRSDQTFSLVIPKGCRVASTPPSEIYRAVHQSLALVLRELGYEVTCWEGSSGKGNMCFENPVKWDLIDSTGRKVAGAGLRRFRGGVLYQGSLGIRDLRLGHHLGRELAGRVEKVSKQLRLTKMDPFDEQGWLERR